jgi:plastocyanin
VRLYAAITTLVAMGALAAPAAADKVVEAQTVWRFDAMTYTIDQGEPLLFRNADALSPGPHNVTASDAGPDGSPRFASATIPNGQETPVAGATTLATGTYGFICTVHPFMQATLTVTDKGAPATGDAGPAQSPPDTAAPTIRAALRAASLRTKRFRGTVTTDEPAELAVRLTARVGKRTFTVGRASGRTAQAGRATEIVIRASPAAQRRLRRARRARLTLAVEARDASGNVGTATRRRTLER